ncbi:hypothetical protein X772_12370 [Mesorhizobium sp. LSJC280B00]|nr:hypothetical protein X772_12370 [Mesorhizobium sp. LSJC280B00]
MHDLETGFGFRKKIMRPFQNVGCAALKGRAPRIGPKIGIDFRKVRCEN